MCASELIPQCGFQMFQGWLFPSPLPELYRICSSPSRKMHLRKTRLNFRRRHHAHHWHESDCSAKTHKFSIYHPPCVLMDGHLEGSRKIKQRKYIYHWCLLEDTQQPSHYSPENLLDQTRHNVPLFMSCSLNSFMQILLRFLRYQYQWINSCKWGLERALAL